MSKTMPTSESTPSRNGERRTPITQLAEADDGAETLRNFRYQAAYAVMLLAGAAAGRNAIKAVWCEQEDDILGQVGDQLFDAYQVKTRRPENGPWRITDEPFRKAVKTFVRLNTTYHKQFRRFHFVSNADCLQSTAKGVSHLCPRPLAQMAAECLGWEHLAGPPKDGFKALRDATECEEPNLFEVLRRLVFVKGPSRDAFEAELAQNHLRELEWCRLTQLELETVVQKLIDMAVRAAALASQDPARHYACLNGHNDPQLDGKRISLEQFILKSKEYSRHPFRYLLSSTTRPLERDPQKEGHFDKKLRRGGLLDYIPTLRAQLLATEQELLAQVAADPKKAEQMVVQIEGVVRDQCEQAHLRARQNRKPFGEIMLIDVQNRLEKLATEEPARVCGQPTEILAGMAGLLTENCTLWWSEKFNLEEEA